MKSNAEESLAAELRWLRMPQPEREYRFHPDRRWRFDFAWPDNLLAVEVEGGGFVQGRHTRGAGLAADCEKYNTAVLLGWRVLRVTPDQVTDGQAIHWITQGLTARRQVVGVG
jgi:very-short-patch-repair endonuclease